MGFDDLEAAEQDRSDKKNEETDETKASETEHEPDATATASAEPSTTESTVEETETPDSGSEDESSASEVSDTPAFEYDDVKQSPMYARPEAWAALEDTLDLDVVRSLREAGIRNEEKRELHDAVLRVAADHPDEIAEAVQEARESGE